MDFLGRPFLVKKISVIVQAAGFSAANTWAE